ncbi:MAG: hypothetical protein K2N89_10815 [Lachnospiraceae bacterium]|nr:hypothetical protein [Lachnospiraceae bacterium]
MAMEYTEIEKQALDMMRRTDFKNLSKNDVLSIASKLGELRPDVAKDVIAQFPEFAKLIRSSMEEYKDILGTIISSDDESIKQVYAIADKDMDTSADSRKQFYDFVGKVHADLSKCLDNPDLTAEERKDILAQEMEIFKAVSEKDSEIRTHETETVKMVDKKDSEKRQFNWGAIKIASTVLVVGLGIAASTLGGNFNLKLPKKP